VGCPPREINIAANLVQWSSVVMHDEAAPQASVLSVVFTVSFVQQMQFARDLALSEGDPQAAG
jgi:hypothetical protein